MRIYTTCKEAVKETERDLWEMGIEVHTYSMQDKIIEGDKSFFTKELSPYTFQITKSTQDTDEFVKYLHPEEYEKLLRWCGSEFIERIASEFKNPGTAWIIRRDIWKEYIHEHHFAYTYNDRIRFQLERIIEELINKPGTRQAIIEVHNNIRDIDKLGGIGRIPCSMHYQMLIRNNKLDMIYIMRSSDLLTHFANDNWLAIALQKYIAANINVEPGRYTFFTGSLHAYYKDMEKRGIF